MKRDDFEISCQALIYAHKKGLQKQHCSTKKKSSFQLSKWLALTVMLVKCQVNLVSFLKKGTHIFV